MEVGEGSSPLVEYSTTKFIGEEQSIEHVLSDQEVEKILPSPPIRDALDPYVLEDRIVKWEYDEGVDDDVKVKAYEEFTTDDSFIQTKEFKEFVIQFKSQ